MLLSNLVTGDGRPLAGSSNSGARTPRVYHDCPGLTWPELANGLEHPGGGGALPSRRVGVLELPSMWLARDEFADLVVEALETLPDTVQSWFDNVEVVVEDWPSPGQLGRVGLGPGRTLLGLYEGVPRTSRTAHYGMVLPDKITIFRGPLLEACATEAAVQRQVRRTVLHELAHHLGIDDDRLRELNAY